MLKTVRIWPPYKTLWVAAFLNECLFEKYIRRISLKILSEKQRRIRNLKNTFTSLVTSVWLIHIDMHRPLTPLFLFPFCVTF